MVTGREKMGQRDTSANKSACVQGFFQSPYTILYFLQSEFHPQEPTWWEKKTSLTNCLLECKHMCVRTHAETHK